MNGPCLRSTVHTARGKGPYYDDPMDMIAEMKARKHTFTEPDDLFIDRRGHKCYGEGFVDFHGNRREVSAAFHYRIYDEALLEKIHTAVASQKRMT